MLLYVKPTPTPHGRTGALPRANPRRAHLVRTTNLSYPPSQTIYLPYVPLYFIRRFGCHQGFSTKHIFRPSVVRYVIRRKCLLTTFPIILVPNKLYMGPSRMRPSFERQDTQPSNQPFTDNFANRLRHN